MYAYMSCLFPLCFIRMYVLCTYMHCIEEQHTVQRETLTRHSLKKHALHSINCHNIVSLRKGVVGHLTDLEGLFVDVYVVANVIPLGLAEEDEVFEEEDAADAFLLPEENGELVLANELALFFQVHLMGRDGRE